MRSEMAHRATRKIVGIIIGFLIILPLIVFILGEVVMHLWNWLMPMIFHLPALTSFWQAVGLMILSWTLFGGLRGARGAGRRYHGGWRRRMEERWEENWQRMTPEERDKFREWVRTRCGPAAPSPATGA